MYHDSKYKLAECDAGKEFMKWDLIPEAYGKDSHAIVVTKSDLNFAFVEMR